MKGKSIIAREGDGGLTRLANGSRVRKSHPRVEACGDVDELNSLIGMVCLCAPARVRAVLRGIQGELFLVGAAAASAPARRAAKDAEAAVKKLERETGRLAAGLPALRGFILPGGTEASAWAHLARCAARRAERHAEAALGKTAAEAGCLKYLNRLSDYLFVLARRLNAGGRKDIPWRPPGGRKR